jgi:hypothetical protein
LVLATVSTVYMLNGNAYDAARWRAGEQLVALGVPADEIHAGFEWMGYHATSPGDPTRPVSANPLFDTWWPSFRLCGLVSADTTAPPGGTLVGTTEYALNLISGPTATLYLYRFSSSSCVPR